MVIDIKDFEYDDEPKYCPKCQELVILRDGKRSCKCTRVKRCGDPDAVKGWVDREDAED